MTKIRISGEVAMLFIENGQIETTAFITPNRNDRNNVRKLFKNDEFIEVFIDCPLEVCERRDPKGLYKKARNGAIKHFTGIDSSYELPINQELTINTEQYTVKEASRFIITYYNYIGIISSFVSY